MKPITVLITGAGAPGAPGIIKSLRLVKERKIRIIGTDMKKDAVGFSMVDKAFGVPSAEKKEFLGNILQIAKKEKVDVILPLNTVELLSWANIREELVEQGIMVLVSRPEGIQIANNKYLLFKHCQEHGIPTPECLYVRNYRQFEEAVFQLGYPKKNVCFKPPVAHGQRGFRILTKFLSRFDLLMVEKPNNTLTTLEDVRPILKSAKPFPELLVMEYLPGEEYSVDVLVDNGKVIAVIPRLREELKMGISFIGTTVHDKEIIKYSRKIAQTLALHGNIGFQFKRDDRGVPKVIESNPRAQGTIVLCTAAGANLVYLAVQLALGEKIEKPKVKWGTKMVRFWDEMYYDAKGNSFRL